MDKNEFAALLRAHGYDAEKVNGCVIVTSPDVKDLQKVQALAQEAGYGLSYGWRKQRDVNV